MSRLATNFTVLDQALVSGVNFITGLVLARFLGIDAYGLFILLSGVILFTSNIQNAIIISPMMVIGPSRHKEQAHRYYQASVIIQSAVTLLFFLLILAIGTLLNQAVPDLKIDDLIFPLALATSGLLMQEFFRRYFFSNNKTIHALINDILSYGLQLFVLIIAQLIDGLDLKSCLYIMAATSYVAVAHGILTSKLLIDIQKISMPDYRQISLEHWDFGKWLVARNLMYWLSTQYVIYLTGIMLSIEAVGAMGAARNIVGIVNILFLALDNFATPRASSAYQTKGVTGLSKYLKRITVLGGFATGVIAATASLAPNYWLNILYSDEYASYGWVVIAWSLYFMIGYFQRPFSIGLRILNSTKSIFTGTLISGIIVISLSLPLVYHLSLEGAMTILIASQISISTYYILTYYKKASG